ncbi:MAG: family 78 glycoside hydrolase catalytic domain [Clostridia bacterium]|nr:family 78 glycoside hydrolase catalytic domain [Clostridia bacterium]
MKKRICKKRLLFYGILLLCMLSISIFAESGGKKDMYITDLKVNNLTEPLGIDTLPTFRWVNHASGYARAQSAYRIVVASSAETAAAHTGDVWDSGRVESGLNYDIAYGGGALADCTEYFFAVQVWDERGSGVWSEVSRFCTGFFDADAWTAKWIGAEDGDRVPCDVALDGANWIWLTDGAATTGAGTEYFRKWFTVDENREVDEVLLAVTMDDYGCLFVNCSTVLRVQNKTDEWKCGKVVNITPYVEKGENIFGAKVTNSVSSGGLIAKIEVRYTDGGVDTTVTDTSWLCAKSVTSASGWERPGYNDTAWSPADMAIAYGGGPWGNKVVMPQTMPVNVGAGAPMLRKTFVIAKEVKNAKLYISGLGLYDLYVNGRSPDDTVLNPAHTQYEDTVHYRAYDVTDLLTVGKNAVAVELGNYFYNCDFYTWMNWNTAIYRDEPKLLLELRIAYADGTSEIVATDESWKTYEYGPVTDNNVYKGEHYDARRAVDGWTAADFDESAWKNAAFAAAPTGNLVFENMEPIRRLETFRPEVCSKGDGTYIIKNPVMTTGWAKIRFSAPAGTEIRITYGEKLDDLGFVVPALNGYPLQVDRFITSGGADVYEPKYSYKGFAYIQIDNYGGELAADDVECYLIANAIADTAEFETGDSRINHMQEMMLCTVKNNLQSKLTDTPVYEKNGWTGDINFALESINFNYDLSNILPKILRDMGDTTNAKGAVNQIAPAACSGGASIPIWTSVFIGGYYENYRTYGVFSAAEENYDLIRLQTLDYINTIKNNGWVWTTGSYADWVSPNPSAVYVSGRTTHAPEGAGIIGSAYVYRTLGQMAEIADKLGKTADAAEYRAAMANIYTAFNETFYDAKRGYYDTGYWDDTYDAGRTKYRQASNIIPLMFGLCPAEYEQSVVQSVVGDIRAKGDHLDVGAVGTKYILPMLSKYGHGDLAMTLVQQDTYPSWGYWITLGANTCWETYESNARSRNHFFLGTYTDWFYKNLAGISDHTNGFETVVLAPEIHPEIGYARYALDTVRGRLCSDWRFTKDGKLVWEVTVPVGTTAHVYLPAAADISAYPCITQNGEYLTVPSGVYVFTMDGGAFAVDKSLLIKAIASAGAISADDYTKASQAALADALAAAEAVRTDAHATAYAVCRAKNALETAVGALIENTPKAELRSLAECAERIDGGILPKTVFDALSTIVAAAKRALAAKDYTDKDYTDASLTLETALAAVSAYGKRNLALGKAVTASSSVENASWGAAKLTDGDRNNDRGTEICGWSSSGNVHFDHTEQVCVDLGAVYKIDRVQVMPAGSAQGEACVAFPRDFAISLSTDGERWTAVYTAENYPVPTTEMQTFDFAAADARYIRFAGTSLRRKPTDGNRYRMQLAKLEAYNTAVTYTDVDLDGDVDILDGLKLLKMALDKDGGVRLCDVLRVFKRIAK